MTDPPEPRPPADEALWKLAEYERHFNIIQAGLRGLASVWLLASFGTISTLLKQAEAETLLVSVEWVIVTICLMGSTGLALIWIVDQLVYHRLLNAIFLVGMKLEFEDRDRPPFHAAMYASMPKRGYSFLLSLFYALPIVALGATALAAAGHRLSEDPTAPEVALLVLALLPLVVAVAIERKSARERMSFRSQASGFHERSFEQLFESMTAADGVSSILARYGREREER